LGAGRVLLAKKDTAPALDELKQAEYLAPSNSNVHDVYAQALEASGDIEAAISEFKQAVALNPSSAQVMLELAAAMEKKGDWSAAIDEYHKAALLDSSVDLRAKIVRADDLNPQNEYKYAQERLKEHIASLKAAGKTSQAAQLEASVRGAEAAPSLSEKLDAALQAGAKANSQRHFDEATLDYKQAVEIAEKIQPRDQRLASALDHLGNEYFGQDPAAAEAAYERELKVTEEIYGAQSANLAAPLQSLGRNALMQKDYASAEKFFFRAVDVNEKVYGEGSDKVAHSLLIAASVYIAQKDYAKAETYLVRALNIDESLFGHDGVDLLMPLASVCTLYDKWGKPDKLEPCDRQLLVVLEKQFGPNSPQLVSTLTSEAQALRNLGRAKEAADVEDRLASIRSSTMNRP
jgi:tetratricopeptide (TPR) repeat protein